MVTSSGFKPKTPSPDRGELDDFLGLGSLDGMNPRDRAEYYWDPMSKMFKKNPTPRIKGGSGWLAPGATTTTPFAPPPDPLGNPNSSRWQGQGNMFDPLAYSVQGQMTGHAALNRSRIRRPARGGY